MLLYVYVAFIKPSLFVELLAEVVYDKPWLDMYSYDSDEDVKFPALPSSQYQ